MASLYKKPILIRDPRTGQRIKAKSRKWWGRYRDALGREKRVPLAADKTAAQAMLNDIVRRVELERAGRFDPFEEHKKRPLGQHLQAFERYLADKGATEQQVRTSRSQLRMIAEKCKWKTIPDITAGTMLAFLADLKRSGRSAQTCNHYLKIAKQFTRWLVRDRRAPENVLEHLSRMNVRLDRRHDRRALSDDEFRRLVEAARSGPRVEGIDGADRAMMYVLAAWTGFRKGEIGSLTLRSLRLDDDPPTATVAACYSKHRREDTQVLHPEMVRQLKEWLAAKDQLHAEEPLFPISGRVPGGLNRKTHKMIERDLMAARDKWLDEAETPEEYDRRLKSDFLCYCNHDGLYADFHGLRHLFITRLERAGVSPKMAQTLARHSDIRLTLGIYTHLEVNDQAAAICSLPAPPGRAAEEASVFMAETGTYGRKDVTCEVPTVVPRGAENGAVQLTSPAYQRASICTETVAEQSEARQEACRPKIKRRGTLCTALHQFASICTDRRGQKAEHPRQGSNL